MCLARLRQPLSTTDPLSFKGSHFKSSNVCWGVQAERNMDSQIWSSRCHWRAADRDLSSRCNAPKTFSLHSSAEAQGKNLLACQPELRLSYFQHLGILKKHITFYMRQKLLPKVIYQRCASGECTALGERLCHIRRFSKTLGYNTSPRR